MNSPIKLPPLPPVPPETIIHQGHVLHQRYGQDEDALRAWATAYAEQAVREALAALQSPKFIYDIESGAVMQTVVITDIDERAAFEDWVLSRYPDSPYMRWREDDGYVYVNEEWNAWKARASLTAEHRCEYCDGTGDVHSLDGEWRGICTCPIGRALASAPPKENNHAEGADIQHP